jgi:hypothetical protein
VPFDKLIQALTEEENPNIVYEKEEKYTCCGGGECKIF